MYENWVRASFQLTSDSNWQLTFLQDKYVKSLGQEEMEMGSF